MRLDRFEAIRARIGEIERKLAELNGGESSKCASRGSCMSFAEALEHAQSPASVRCPDDLVSIINNASQKYGIEPAVIKAVIRAESGFRPDAVSRAGAKGLMQLMPGTARALGVNPLDPEQCVDGGTRYLKQMIDRFGSLELALAAYNAGPGSVSRYNGIPPYEETRRYVSNVMQYINDYTGEE